MPMDKLNVMAKLKCRNKFRWKNILKFMPKVRDNKFIVKNLFKKGLVVAFLFVVLVSINLGVASSWRELLANKEKLEEIKSAEYDKLYNSVAAGNDEEEKTFVLKDDLIEDKYNIKGTAAESNWYADHVEGFINLGKKSDNTRLKWRIVGNESEKGNKYDIILQATEPITYAPYNLSTDTKTFNGETVWASHYGASDVRALLNDMTSDSNTTYFTSGEKAIMNTTTFRTTNSKEGSQAKYNLSDKLYLPGGSNEDTVIYVGKDTDIVVDGGYFDQYTSWTRSDNGHSTQVACAYYWYDTSHHTKVILKDVTDSTIGVKPFVNIDLNSVYFGSTVEAATADATTKHGTTSMYTGLNLRFNGGSKLGNGKVQYTSSTVTYSGSVGQAVVVQGKDSSKGHWYYSKYISSDVNGATITPSEIATALGLQTQPDFEQCNIWIEQLGDDGLIYARLASVEINQIIYEGISGNNPTGFKYNSGTKITSEELDKLGISARIENNEHIITMNGFRVHGSMSDPLHILDSSNYGVMDSVTIELIGNNSIESKGGGAFWSRAEVTFTGTGNLTNIATTADNARGIAVDRDMIFEHTGTIIVYGWEGLRTPEGSRDIIVNSGTVITTGLEGTSCRKLIVNGGNLEALVPSSGNALYAQNNIEINGGKVYVETSGKGFNCSNVAINDGEVEIYEDGTDVKGISATTLTIGDTNQTKNPIVNISGNLGAASGYQYHASGINVSSFTINSGDINIDLKNKNTTGYISGIYVSGSVAYVKGGKIQVKMNENTRNNSLKSNGIHMGYGSFHVEGGKLDVINDGYGDALSLATIDILAGVVNASVFGTDCSSIYCSNSINIQGGEVNVSAHTNENHGIYCGGIINIGADGDDVDDTTIVVTRDDVSGAEDNTKGIYAGSNINVYEGTITIGTEETPGFHYGLYANGTLTVYNGEIRSHGYKTGIYTINMGMKGGYVFAKTTSDGSIRMDRRAIIVSNSLEMEDGHIDVELVGQRGVGLIVEGTLGGTHITGGKIEAEVSGIYTKGMRILGALKIGTIGTEGPTIIINGDIQNEQESWGINYDESGIYAEKNIEINSGNIKIAMKNRKAVDMNNPSNPANNYIAGIMTKNSADAGIVINGGTIDLNVDVEQPDGSYSGGDGMFTYGHITINGGRITSTTNGGVYWVGTKLYHSSGINAKTDLTIKGGEVRATNTNTTYKYNNELIGMGLYSDADIILDGGHIVARGIGQALYVAEGHSVTSTTTDDGNTEAGVITKFGSVNYNGTPLVEYDISADSKYENEDYKYVEIGVRHPYYLRYDVADNTVYKGPEIDNGDGTKSDVHFGNNTNDSVNVLATMGITFDVDASSGKKVIKLKNIMFESFNQYGLYIDGDAIIELEKNSINRIVADSTGVHIDEIETASEGSEDNPIASQISNITERYGIYSKGIITIRGEGQLVVSGETTAIKSEVSTVDTSAIILTKASTTGADYDVVPIEGSKTSTLSENLTSYPQIVSTSDWNSYKYVKIGSLPMYYFKYDVANNRMWKMIGNSGIVINNNEVADGWRIENNELVLDGFEFGTSAQCALMIEGNGTVRIKKNCSITTQYMTSGENYGIQSDSALTLTGTGKVELQRGMSSRGEYVGIYCSGDMSITSGTYYVNGQKYGIYVGGNNFTVRNATVEASATSSANNAGAIYLNKSSIRCDVYESIKAGDNADGSGALTVTDYETTNHTYNTTYNTKKYIKMVSAVSSITITWGDMAFMAENIWNPENHTYTSVIKPSNDTSGLISIYNNQNAGSNIPIKALVNVNMSNSRGIVGKLDDEDGTITTKSKIVGVNEKFESTLILDTTQYIPDGINETVGTVSVTLSDYRKEQ